MEEAADNLLYLSRWAPEPKASVDASHVLPAAPPSSHTPSSPDSPKFSGLVSPTAPRSSPVSIPQRPLVAQMRRDAAAGKMQDLDNTPPSSEDEEDFSRLDVQWDEEPVLWDDSSSDDGEVSEGEVTEDSTSEVSTPAPGTARKDPYSITTRKFPSCAANNMILNKWKANPVATKPQGGLENSRWAAPPKPGAMQFLPRQLQHQARVDNPPMLFQRSQHADGFGSRPPLTQDQAALVVAAQNKPPSQASSLLLQAPRIFQAPPQAPKSFPKSVQVSHVAGRPFDSPTYLDYPIAPTGMFPAFLPLHRTSIKPSAQIRFDIDQFLAIQFFQIVRSLLLSISFQTIPKQMAQLTNRPACSVNPYRRLRQ